ncbi:MAG: error-prone DNA polymerase, partial [Polyangiaceae bacterium]|nr:error-prone DNA polymerase [Polyangiaceae bacterium]
MFVELLGRSNFSFLQGASHPEELVEQSKALKLGGLALTDKNSIYGSVRAWKAIQALKKKGGSLHYIVGTELTLPFHPPKTPLCAATSPRQLLQRSSAFSEREERPISDSCAPTTPLSIPPEGQGLELALLVETLRGYENLCRIITASHDGYPKGEALCQLDTVRQNYEGLTALLIAPKDPQRLSSELKVDDLITELKDIFGSHLALAVYRHLDGRDGSRIRWTRKNAHRFCIPIIASARPLYHHPSRKPLFDTLSCIRQGLSLEQAGTRLAPNAEASLRDESDMRRLFSHHPEWLEETNRIADRCHFDFSQIHYQFPCHLEPHQSADQRLAELTWEGVGRRYPEGISSSLRQQLKKELQLIHKLQLAPYFLSTYDIVQIARRKKILCQGRGSAANSAVCFVLGITAVDPARSHLLFERFLSEERNEPPDIDLDFEHERREEVIQEIYRVHGRQRAAMVSEIISYRQKSALRDVAQVFSFSQEQIKRLSSTVSWQQNDVDREKRLLEAGFDLRDSRLAQIFALAEQLQGFPRHLSLHVGGFFLSSRPLAEVAPIESARKEGRTVIPWDKDDIEALGFFKVDILALGMLTALRKSLALITADGGLPPPSRAHAGTSDLARESKEAFDPLEIITRIPAEDPATYRMISQADTVGVFQIESRAQRAMLPRLRPQQFYDLVIEVALVRPGPIQGGMVHPYLRRRNQEEPISCPHRDLWPVLKRTLGVPLFQEQVMQIAIIGAGYRGGEADELRRDMAAWKKHGRLSTQKDRLLRGFHKKGISKDFALSLFEQIKGFGEYGFPESHASSFALLVYASAWQKHHYPAHFVCALLNSQPMGFYS